MSEDSSPYFSRFVVIDEQEKAWAVDDKFHMYAYDGMRFWRRRKHSTRYMIVPSWKTPSFGWMHADGCACHRCARGEEASKAA